MKIFTLHESSSIGRITLDTLSIMIDFDSDALGNICPITERAVRHLTGLVRPEDNLKPLKWNDWDTTIRAYSDEIMNFDSSGEQHDIFLLYISGFIHEIRHAHDLLSTCYGQYMLFSLMNCYQNVNILLGDLKDWQISTQKPIPIPLQESNGNIELSSESWMVINQYREIIKDLKGYHQPLDTPYWLTPNDILETSACNTQLAFLNEMFGTDQSFKIMTQIASSAKADNYLRARNTTLDYLSSCGVNRIKDEAINYLVWASLMMLTPRGEKMSKALHPVISFEGFVEQLGRDSKNIGIDEAIVAVKGFCDEWGLQYPSEMAKYYERHMSNNISKLPDGTPDQILQCHLGLKKSFLKLQTVIDNYPKSYFDGQAYPWTLISNLLPSVFVRTRSDGNMSDFLSAGEDILTSQDWSFLDATGSIMRILSEGFGSLADSKLETTILNTLSKDRDHNYKFTDGFFD